MFDQRVSNIVAYLVIILVAITGFVFIMGAVEKNLKAMVVEATSVNTIKASR